MQAPPLFSLESLLGGRGVFTWGNQKSSTSLPWLLALSVEPCVTVGSHLHGPTGCTLPSSSLLCSHPPILTSTGRYIVSYPGTFQTTEGIYYHTFTAQNVLTGEFHECNTEFLFSPVLWALDGGTFSGFLVQLHLGARNLSFPRRM